MIVMSRLWRAVWRWIITAWRWIVAVAAFFGVFTACWGAWYVFRWPPSGADRLGVALAVAAVVSAGLSGPLFYWAGRERSAVRGRNDQAAAGPALLAGRVVVGEIPREPAAFVARGTVDRLASAAGSGEVAVLCAVTGLRGVGKTQVAAAYARQRVAEGWGLVGWVNAESRDVLLAGLARVAAAAGVADPEGDSAESARRLREHLQTRTSPGLLVFDNAADPDGLRPFLPATGSMQIVVTSTDRAFAGMGVPVDVSVFTRPESVGYLAARTGLADDADADAVAAELGDLPLGPRAGSGHDRRRGRRLRRATPITWSGCRGCRSSGCWAACRVMITRGLPRRRCCCRCRLPRTPTRPG